VSAHLTDEQRDAVAKGSTEPGFDAHLKDCADCRAGVADAKARQRLLSGLTPYTLNDMAFRRVEARLMEQVEEGLPSPWPSWLKVALPALACVVVLLVVAPWRAEPTPSPDVFPRPAIARPAPRSFSPMTATFASADATRRPGDGAWMSLRAGDTLTADTAVSASRLVVASADLVLVTDGSWAAGGQAQVVLGAGVVTASGTAEVLAGPRRVMGVESVFRVERTAAEVVVDVASGTVEVFDESSGQRRSVASPARLRWADGTALEQGVSEAIVTFESPRAPKGPVVPLDLSGLPVGTTVSLDGQGFGETPFTLAADPGRHRLNLTPPGQPGQERFIDLVGGAPFLVALQALESDREVEAPEPDARALARVLEDLKRQTPKLRACYEKWLKANPSASGQIDLVLVVTAKGSVKRADVKGDPISPESATCLKTTAKSLVLSPLGSEQELEVPLVLTPGKR
jgi:hypothetical protein